MTLSRYSAFIPQLAILGSVTSLGLGTSWAKHTLFPLVDAQGTTAVRVGFSALLLLLFWRPWRWHLSRADARAVVLYGAALGAMNLCFYLALRTIPFGIAVAIEFSGPLAVALAIAGLGLLLPLAHNVSGLDPRGVGFAMAAAVFWATYIVFGKRASAMHAGHSVSLGLLVAAIVVVPVGVVHAGSALLSPTVLLVGLGVALVSSAIPISLEMLALKLFPPQAFGIMASMEPAVAAILALFLLDEYLSSIQWLAIAMIMAASMGSSITGQRTKPLPVTA